MSHESGVSASARTVVETRGKRKRTSTDPRTSTNPLGEDQKNRSDQANDGAVGISKSKSPKAQQTQSTSPPEVDDESFARRLQEEENQRYKAESRRRGEEWRRQHEMMMFGVDDLDEYEDDEDDLDEDEGDVTAGEDEGDAAAHEGDAVDAAAADAFRLARREATRAARARIGQMHRFFGQMHAHIHAAGATPGERGDLAALCFSDRDFTEDDYERLLTLDNVVVKKGLTEEELKGIPSEVWVEKVESKAPLKTKTKAKPRSKQSDAKGDTARDDDSSDACAICLDPFVAGDAMSKLRCTHRYHHKCIRTWCEAHVECPTCRVDIRKKGNATGKEKGAGKGVCG